MFNLIFPNYLWPNITIDIAQFVKHCDTCEKNKKKIRLVTSYASYRSTFWMSFIDTVGVNKKFLHIIINHVTRFIRAFTSKNVTIETYNNCLMQIFNVQTRQKLLSNRHKSFRSPKFKIFLRKYPIQQRFTFSHHSQTNGKVERLS